MIFGDGRAAGGGIATVAWYNRTYSFAIHWSLLGLLLLDIVCKVGEGLRAIQSQTMSTTVQMSLTNSPFLRSCGVCFIRAAMMGNLIYLEMREM